MLGDTNWPWPIIGLTTQKFNLFQTLQGDKDLNSPRKLSAGAKRGLTLAEKKLQDTHMDQLDPKLDYIFVILPSTHSLTWILMQREYNVIEWIF